MPGGRIEREFQHWHILPLDLCLEDIPLGDDEVSGLVEVSLDQAISLAAGDVTNVPARFLSRTPAGTQVSDGDLASADLIPGYLGTDQLYLRAFALTRRYLAGDRQYLFV